MDTAYIVTLAVWCPPSCTIPAITALISGVVTFCSGIQFAGIASHIAIIRANGSDSEHRNNLLWVHKLLTKSLITVQIESYPCKCMLPQHPHPKQTYT